MPDDQGKLSDAEKQLVKERLDKFTLEPICPVCNTSDWLIADHVVLPIPISGSKQLLLGGVSYPQIMVISTPCGYTRFFNAVVLGVVVAAEPKKAGG